MKSLPVAWLLVAAGVLLTALAWRQRPLPPIEVYFSPKGGVTDAVVGEIGRAEKTVLVQAYSFTSKPIAEALLKAHKRGVQIQVILDSSQETDKYSEADFLLHSQIPVLMDARHSIAHNKVMIIDNQVVITGSFNFSKQAEESNAENLLVIRDQAIADRYTENWRDHAEHSEPYLGKGTSASESRQPSPRDLDSAPGYVSSPNSPLFHKSGCKSASKISAKNRVEYRHRIMAVVAGKKPCPECAP